MPGGGPNPAGRSNRPGPPPYPGPPEPPGPPKRDGPPAGGPPPNRAAPAGRGGRGLTGPLPRGVALSTRIMRPSSCEPLSALIARSASSSPAISTNPKPRERPVSRSVITAADCTGPNRANASRRPSLDVENERPPTNNLTDIG